MTESQERVWADLAAWVASLAPSGRRFVVVIDGGSGSGKTSLGRTLASALGGSGRAVTLVSLDCFYPGWSGLEAASQMVVDHVLAPVASTRWRSLSQRGSGGRALSQRPPGPRAPAYQRWDWDRNVPADWVTLGPAYDLVIEGCGALTAKSRARADLAIWLARDAASRKRLALARDGDAYAPHWDHWADQERRHWERNRPWELADLVVEAIGP